MTGRSCDVETALVTHGLACMSRTVLSIYLLYPIDFPTVLIPLLHIYTICYGHPKGLETAVAYVLPNLAGQRCVPRGHEHRRSLPHNPGALRSWLLTLHTNAGCRLPNFTDILVLCLFLSYKVIYLEPKTHKLMV